MTSSDGGGEGDRKRSVLVEAGTEFMADRAIRLGAGLAYYGLVTLAPLLVLLLGIGGLLVGEEAGNGQLAEYLNQWFGADVAQAFAEMIVALDVSGSFASLTAASLVLLVFTASVLFVAWKDALNVVWGVEYRPNVRTTLGRRLFGIASVAALAAALVAIFVVEALLGMMPGLLPGEPVVDMALTIVISIVPIILGGLLLGASYRYGTDGSVTWRAVWPGTILTMVLLIVLSWGYGRYAGYAGASVAAVASSAILLLVLVYFMAQVLLYGAEIITVMSRRVQI
ncbi:MAG: YihY/virulence factor BrkB family protein [Actinomycetia bacterium]|nr:YihY/virulence factor BrkB family protein [Actinomycetes bacterium]